MHAMSLACAGALALASLSAQCPQGPTRLCIPLDATFRVAFMDGPAGNGQANPNDPCQRNDDDSTLAIALPFTFDLYGQQFTSVHINNNGNVSFGTYFSTFTSQGFPVNNFPMVAPFWGDVDTRPTASGTVWYRIEPNRLVVTWDHVGYYNIQSDKLNTFQLIMTDGTDPLIGIGNNVCFCYDDMQWTTGSASGGSGGFGGTPATVGVNAGNGVDFFQIGRFNVNDSSYDGPGGNPDGVNWLDGQRICFSVGAAVNQPPVFVDLPSDNTFCFRPDTATRFTVRVIPPENNQTITSLTVDSGGLANLSCDPPVLGVNASITCTFTPTAAQRGPHTILVRAIDNLGARSEVRLTLKVCPAPLRGVFGTFVAGGTGEPRISSTADPALGASNDVILTNASPNSPACLVKGFCDDRGTALGCGLTLFVNGWVVCTTTDATGRASVGLAIPNLSTLCGARICFQWFVADPTGPPPCRITQSRGLGWLIGN